MLRIALSAFAFSQLGAQVSVHLPPASPSPYMTQATERIARDGAAAVSAFWADIAMRTTPIVEPFPTDSSFILVTFVYRDTLHAKTIQVSGGAVGWDDVLTKLSPISGTDIWYKTVVLPRAVRIGYQFRVDDDEGPPWYADPKFGARFAKWHGDRLNPNVDSTTRVRGARSKLVGPGADPQPYTIRRADVARGTLDSLSIESKVLGQRRRAWMYMPPATTSRQPPLPLLVMFDGGAYTGAAFVPTPTILDNMLAAGKIRPVAALFVDNGPARMTELGCDSTFSAFVVEELLPLVHSRYSVTRDPAQTAVGGSSQGGLGATCSALRFPKTFGLVISQSGSYWWAPSGDDYEWPAREFARRPRLPLRFYVDVGVFETDRSSGNGPGQVITNRHFRDVLRARGYDVFYQEFLGAHEYFNWRGTISTALERFFAANKR